MIERQAAENFANLYCRMCEERLGGVLTDRLESIIIVEFKPLRDLLADVDRYFEAQGGTKLDLRVRVADAVKEMSDA